MVGSLAFLVLLLNQEATLQGEHLAVQEVLLVTQLDLLQPKMKLN